jgi:hypothetical protein
MSLGGISQRPPENFEYLRVYRTFRAVLKGTIKDMQIEDIH